MTFDPLMSCWLQVSPSMTSAELAETALSMKSVTYVEEDSWITFEVIENGELGTGTRVLGSRAQHLEFAVFHFSEDCSDLQLNAVSTRFTIFSDSYFLL